MMFSCGEMKWIVPSKVTNPRPSVTRKGATS